MIMQDCKSSVNILKYVIRIFEIVSFHFVVYSFSVKV